MRVRWHHLRDPGYAAEIIHAVYAGRPAPDRLFGTLVRCTAPEYVREGCGRFVRETHAFPVHDAAGRANDRTVRLCTHVRECSHQKMTAWRSPVLVLKTDTGEDFTLSPYIAAWVRYVVNHAALRDDLAGKAARLVAADHGSEKERAAAAELDALVASGDVAVRVAHRMEAQKRLAEHLARRTTREHPERRNARGRNHLPRV